MNTGLDVRRVMRDSIRVYFAPLVGAYRTLRAEIRRADRNDRVFVSGRELPKTKVSLVSRRVKNKRTFKVKAK